MSNPPSRRYCEYCFFPQSVCLCDAISSIDNKTKIIVLQHPSEITVAKNTVRLMQLSLQNIEVVNGESEVDFASVKLQVEKAKGESSTGVVAVLYPNEQSSNLEEFTGKTEIKCLILIDGTWRKAYKIWQLNPWLQLLPSFHFSAAPQSQYQRIAKVAGSLSTLEAGAYALSLIENKSFSSLNQLQQARQSKGF